MCFRITRCCCFSNTKDGSFATGVYTLVLSLLSLITCAVTLSQMENIIRDAKEQGNLAANLNPSAVRINLIVSVVWSVVLVFISVSLLYGVKNDNRLLLIPWLIWMAIVIAFQFVLFILFFIAMFANGIIAILMVLFGLFVAFHIYCYSCVFSQYKTLAEGGTYPGTTMQGKV